ncbi:MAG TPA: DNA N-6-adenine-methyltransferase [Xanthomonadaceae bacterium]|jgi:hypothetical protein|uniref:Adenine methyltransferase n=1 Tax=Lysobacter hankyongensis TaxID=1176535 RepID=A0ABP9BKC6_9GAMM
MVTKLKSRVAVQKCVGFDRNAPGGTTTTWLTPKTLVDVLGPFDLDPCVPPQMPWRTATRMLTVKEDGLATPWPRSAFVFHNPPYGKGQVAWMQKAAEHGNGVTLVLARFDTRWMHDWVLNHPATTALVFVKGRVQFCRPDGSPGPSSPAPSIFIGYGKKASKRLERAVRSGAISGAFFAVDRLALVARNHSVAANDECYRLPLGAG